jgi:flagella basal body P-ring formation protein FlgA
MIRRALGLLLAAAALAAAQVEIRIRPATELAAPTASLGEVAEITAEPELAARLAGIVIADLSGLAPVAIDAPLVRALAGRAAPGGLVVTGSGSVVRRARVVDAAALQAACAALLPAAASWSPVRVSSSLTVPDGPGFALEATQLDARQQAGEIAFSVRARDGARETGRALVVLRVERRVPVVVAARDIPRGTLIAASDLRVEQRAADARTAGAATDPAQLVGGLARRDLAAGELLGPALAMLPPAVRAGAPVTAVLPGRGFAIEMPATALADARAGERVQVRRAHDGAVIAGIARADGTVSVTP